MFSILAFLVAVPGILAILLGRVPVSRRRAATGAAARMAGVLLVMPLPAGFVIGFANGFFAGLNDREPNQALVDLYCHMSLAAFVIAAVVVVCLTAHPLESTARTQPACEETAPLLVYPVEAPYFPRPQAGPRIPWALIFVLVAGFFALLIGVGVLTTLHFHRQARAAEEMAARARDEAQLWKLRQEEMQKARAEKDKPIDPPPGMVEDNAPAPIPVVLEPPPKPAVKISMPTSIRLNQPRKLQSLETAQAKVDRFSVEPPLAALLWSSDGKAFYFASSAGKVSRVALEGLVEEWRIDLGRRITGLGVCSEGVVATVPILHEVWLLDALSLDLKKRIPVKNVSQVAVRPNVPWGLTHAPHTSFAIGTIDFLTGETAPAPGLPALNLGLCLAPGGADAFVHKAGELRHFKKDGVAWVQQNLVKVPPVASNELRLDGTLLGVRTSKGLMVFPTAPLAGDGALIPSATHAVALSPNGTTGYGIKNNRKLAVYDPQGAEQREIAFGFPNEAPDNPAALLAHPDESRLIVLSNRWLYLVRLE